MVDDEGEQKGSKRDYDVGYGKPPIHTRFPHQNRGSGARKRKKMSLREHLQAQLETFLTVRDPVTGRTKKVKTAEQIARNVRNKAAQSDPKAVGIFLGLNEGGASQQIAETTQPVLDKVSADDKAIMARFAQKFIAAEQEKLAPSGNEQNDTKIEAGETNDESERK